MAAHVRVNTVSVSQGTPLYKRAMALERELNRIESEPGKKALSVVAVDAFTFFVIFKEEQ